MLSRALGSGSANTAVSTGGGTRDPPEELAICRTRRTDRDVACVNINLRRD